MDEQDHNSKPIGLSLSWDTGYVPIYASGWTASSVFNNKEYRDVICEYCGTKTVISKNSICSCGCPIIYENGKKAKLKSLSEYKINYAYLPAEMNSYISLNIK